MCINQPGGYNTDHSKMPLWMMQDHGGGALQIVIVFEHLQCLIRGELVGILTKLVDAFKLSCIVCCLFRSLTDHQFKDRKSTRLNLCSIEAMTQATNEI